MLRRINAGLFEEDEDSDIELAVKASNNGGTEGGEFDYDSHVFDPDTVQGLPGCRFRVKSGIHQFKVLVAFDPAAPATARYDLFQVNAAGTLMPVGKSVSNTGGTSLIGFGIDGVPVAVPVGVGAGGRRKMPKPPRRARRKTTSSRRKATTSRKPPAPSRKTTSARASKPKSGARTVKAKRPRPQKRPKRVAKKKR